MKSKLFKNVSIYLIAFALFTALDFVFIYFDKTYKGNLIFNGLFAFGFVLIFNYKNIFRGFFSNKKVNPKESPSL